MFGMSFGELVILVVVGLIVMGPKELPKVLRKLGQWAAKARRIAGDLRAQSGIDDVLAEGTLTQDIAEIRKLARGELDGVVRAARVAPLPAAKLKPAEPEANAASEPKAPVASPSNEPIWIAREREYPREGADSYGALPDTAIVYATNLPRSALADDALYMTGDAETPAPLPAASDETALSA